MSQGSTQSTRRTCENQRRQAVIDIVLPLSLGLGVILVLVKMLLLPFPVSTLGELVRWLLRLAVVVAPDICFLAALATFCGLTLLVARRARRSYALWKFATFGVY